MANITTTTTYGSEYLAQDRRPLVKAFFFLPIPLGIISTALRIWVKKRHPEERIGFDDYLIVWATIAAVAECIAGLVYGAPHGLGRHVETLKPGDVSRFLKGGYIFSHFCVIALASTKLSILAFYYRTFATTRMRVLSGLTAVAVFIWLAETEAVLGLGCRPIQGWWDPVVSDAECVDKAILINSTNVLNLLFDLWVFAMPISDIWKLNMKWDNKRLATCLLFAVGLGVCAISIARLCVVSLGGNADVTWQGVSLGILSAWEPCGTILCVNIPIVYGTLHDRARKPKHSVGGFGSDRHERRQLFSSSRRDTVTTMSAQLNDTDPMHAASTSPDEVDSSQPTRDKMKSHKDCREIGSESRGSTSAPAHKS